MIQGLISPSHGIRQRATIVGEPRHAGLAQPLTESGHHEDFLSFQVIVLRDAQSVNAGEKMGQRLKRPERLAQAVIAARDAAGFAKPRRLRNVQVSMQRWVK
jgi:hypothetical protein